MEAQYTMTFCEVEKARMQENVEAKHLIDPASYCILMVVVVNTKDNDC